MFDPRLINDPFGDPGVYVEMKYRREALLLDLGDLQSLPPRNPQGGGSKTDETVSFLTEASGSGGTPPGRGGSGFLGHR